MFVGYTVNNVHGFISESLAVTVEIKWLRLGLRSQKEEKTHDGIVWVRNTWCGERNIY